ncbi:MAG TPA: hypothetical protein VD969_08070 [Symbiobacteriaceae bacterium]|nr:hypothetical protein [Symbiobacteriaceae bacterium]
MKRRKLIAAALVVVLLAMGAVAWFSRERRPVIELATNFVKSGTVAVRVDRFEMTRTLPGRMRRFPPPWMARYPTLLKAWEAIYLEHEQIMDGLVWVVVEATVASEQPLQGKDFDYRLDYGPYTMGAHGGSIREAAGRPYLIGTRFYVTDGPVPEALEIKVNGEWLRFPITVQ